MVADLRAFYYVALVNSYPQILVLEGDSLRQARTRSTTLLLADTLVCGRGGPLDEPAPGGQAESRLKEEENLRMRSKGSVVQGQQ